MQSDDAQPDISKQLDELVLELVGKGRVRAHQALVKPRLSEEVLMVDGLHVSRVGFVLAEEAVALGTLLLKQSAYYVLYLEQGILLRPVYFELLPLKYEARH